MLIYLTIPVITVEWTQTTLVPKTQRMINLRKFWGTDKTKTDNFLRKLIKGESLRIEFID